MQFPIVQSSMQQIFCKEKKDSSFIHSFTHSFNKYTWAIGSVLGSRDITV